MENDQSGQTMIAGVRQAADFRSVYANGASLRYTPWDLTIIFSRSIGTGGGAAVSEEVVEITCSPSHMKAVANALMIAVKAYEERFGEIPTPPTDPEVLRALLSKSEPSS